MQTPQEMLLYSLYAALDKMPVGSVNRRSVMQTLRYAQRSCAAADAEERRELLRVAAAHLKRADKECQCADEQAALGKVRRAMTAALFESMANVPCDAWPRPEVTVRYLSPSNTKH